MNVRCLAPPVPLPPFFSLPTKCLPKDLIRLTIQHFSDVFIRGHHVLHIYKHISAILIAIRDLISVRDKMFQVAATLFGCSLRTLIYASDRG